MSPTFFQKPAFPKPIPVLSTDISYTTVPAGKMDVTGYSLGIVLTLLMFFAVYFYGYGVAMSVASEKTSRVMETLVVSAKPSRIFGKCVAMGVQADTAHHLYFGGRGGIQPAYSG